MSWFSFTSTDLRIAFWTILVAILCNVSCALLGCYLVLRRMSLVGDAISHAVLPGIVMAFLLAGQVSGVPILLGGMAVGVLTVFLTESLHKAGIAEDASLGVVFTALFALGVILLQNTRAGKVDLDPGCVLYGAIEFIYLDMIPLAGLEVPRALPTLGLALLLTVGFLLLLWKELKIVSFDAALAQAMGYNPTLVHYLLMAMVAGVTVAAFEAVGSILVVAMLIVPAATAHLLTDRLGWMLVWAAVVGTLSAVLGYAIDSLYPTSLAGMMTVTAGGLFLLAVLFAPRHGLLSKAFRHARLQFWIVGEDLLAYLYRQEEEAGSAATISVLEARRAEGGLVSFLTLPLLRWTGQVRPLAGGRIALTERGRERARSLVRAHRLWEAYLQENLDLPADHLHEPASRMEHYLGPDFQTALAAQLRQAEVDPHGRDIPPSPAARECQNDQ